LRERCFGKKQKNRTHTIADTEDLTLEKLAELCASVRHTAVLPTLCGRLLRHDELMQMSEGDKFTMLHAAAAALSNACRQQPDFDALTALVDNMLALLGTECTHVRRYPAVCVSAHVLVHDLGVYSQRDVQTKILLPRAGTQEDVFLPIFLCLLLAASAHSTTRALYEKRLKLSFPDVETHGSSTRMFVLLDVLSEQSAGDLVKLAMAQQIADAIEYSNDSFRDTVDPLLENVLETGLPTLMNALDHHLAGGSELGDTMCDLFVPNKDVVWRECYGRHLTRVRAREPETEEDEPAKKRARV